MTSINPTNPTEACAFVRPKRNASITVHLSKEEKARLDKLAFESDVGTSQFVRKILISHFAHANGTES